MNNENNNNIESNDNGFLPGVNNNDNSFLPGFDRPLDNPNQFQSNDQFIPPQDANFTSNVEPNQVNMSQAPNMGSNPYDMNQVPNMGSNPYDMNQAPNMSANPYDVNQIPNMGPNQFDMNQVPNMGPNQFDMNQVPNMGPNQFDMNQAPNMGPNQFDMNQAPNMEPNQFDMNQAPNMGPNQFDMNQVPNMEPNQFDMNQNANNGFNPDMNQGGFDANQYVDYSDYTDDFTKTWMGKIYDKAHSKKFNWCAALFGPAYLFYRKVYLTGALATLIFMIINIIFALLKLENPFILVGVNVVLTLVYFLGLGFGFYPIYKDFVHKQLEKYKKQFADNDQLVSVASKKGGTSIAGLIVYYLAVGVITSVLAYTLLTSAFSSLIPKTPQTPITNQTSNTNQIPEVLTDEFNFADNYIISYPVATWAVGTDNKSLVSGDYTLLYRITYKASDLGVTEMASAEGRTSILRIINNSVTALATANNLHMEPEENFTRKNDVYYTYIDLSSDVAVTRYYFILVPDENILFQFELNVNDTAIDYDTNKEVNDMLTSITTDISLEENDFNNTLSIPNDINNVDSNSIDVNDTNSVNSTVSNAIDETNNTVTNSANYIPSSNDTMTDNSVNSTSTNITSNNVISSSLGILQDID